MRDVNDDERQRLADVELLASLRAGDPGAWPRLVKRVRPLLLAMAARSGNADDPTCVDDLLADLAVRLSDPQREPPRHLTAYVVQAARFCQRRRYHLARVEARRWEADGAEREVALALQSAWSRDRAAAADAMDSDHDEGAPSDGHQRLMDRLRGAVRTDERQLLAWYAAGVPIREIAEWLDTSPASLRTRLTRLRAALRRIILEEVRQWNAPEQRRWRRQWHVDGTDVGPSDSSSSDR